MSELINPFSCLGVPLRPFPDPTEIEEKARIAREGSHPDLADDGEERHRRERRMAEINQAKQMLSDDVVRLRAVLVLHGVEKPDAATSVPKPVMAWFEKTASALEAADRCLEKVANAEGALGHALVQPQVLEQALELQNIAGGIGREKKQLLEEMKGLDAVWEECADIEALHSAYIRLVYFQRWARQIDDRLFQLMNAPE